MNTEKLTIPEPFGLNDEQRDGKGWMVIGVDNYGRESVEDFIVCRDVRSARAAEIIVEALNTGHGNDVYYQAVPHNHKLCRGMWDLV